MLNQQTFILAQQEHVRKRVKDLSKRSDEIKSRLATTLKHLWWPERPLAVISDLSCFSKLKERFPNFIEVINLLESNAIGLNRLGMPFEVSPILLLGDPGLGKTLFVSEFARLASIPFYELSLATISASFALTGGNIQWSEGSVGFIASSLAESKFANPVFLIDEIDKVSGSDRYKPLNAFYSLLESHTAKRFKDEALEIEINASRIIWIATANDIRHVPQPILSRMTVIDIRPPSADEMKLVVKSVYQRFRNSKPYGIFLSNELSDEAIDLFTSMSPREARIAIETAGLCAIRKNLTQIEPSDIPKFKRENSRVGFY